jgi:hypothetical protein
MPGSASGFCVYNDPAVAIAWLLSQGAERIAYVDSDAHHGDGVEKVFRDDPRVLTIGLHEHPDTLFPGTGRPDETGGPHADGSAVNVALPAGAGDAGWLRAFHAVVPPIVRSFGLQLLVSQHGCDSHRDDPLTNLALSIDGQRAVAVRGPDRDGLRVRSAVSGQHLVGLHLDRRLSLLGEVQVGRGGGHAAEVAHDGRVDGEYGEWRVAHGRFVHGPLQGPLRMTGTVDADDDARHFNCPFARTPAPDARSARPPAAGPTGPPAWDFGPLCRTGQTACAPGPARAATRRRG